MREYKGKPAADAAGFSDSAAGTSVHAVCQPGFFFTLEFPQTVTEK